MPVIENIKNFIRHGKQARQQEASPATHSLSDPPPRTKDEPDTDNHNVVPEHISPHGGITSSGINKSQGKGYDQETLARLVAEEKANREKLPHYPGLERWALVSKMGDGAFSNVYRARDTQGVYGDVAIKVVRKFELNASQRANILKEVSIMKRLDHPNIVKLIDFKEAKAYYYLILELCPGGELFHQIVRLTYFSEDLSRHVIVQVAEALKYLHNEKGVVHRDIKPENLLFYPTEFVPEKNPKPRSAEDEAKEDEGQFIPGVGAGGIGRIKIADFGLSKVIWEDTTVTPCGTVGYTAPEIVKDERYSKSVDMWALGCVLYTLLCGFPPFYDESISVLTEKVARGQYTFLSPWWDDISKSAQDLVSHLLTVDPDKRYSIEQFMDHPWIKNSQEPTSAAKDAPPLATPAVTKDKRAYIMDTDSPLLAPIETPGGRRMDFRSPGAVSLREVFDVGYAVHRMEEENKRRKNFKHGYQDNALNEEDEESMSGDSDNEVAASKAPKDGAADDVADTLRRTNLNPAPAPSNIYSNQVANARAPPASAATKKANAHAMRAGINAASKKRTGPGFELVLDNATLIGRRKRGDHSPPIAG